MILDKLGNAHRYDKMHPLFQQAFDYALSPEFKGLIEGTHHLLGEDLFVIIATDTSREHLAKLEAHKKYIDIQMTIEGAFEIGWKSLSLCKTIEKAFDYENDFMLFADMPDFNMLLEPETFAIFFPEDAHSPNAPKSYVKKAIFKIAV